MVLLISLILILVIPLVIFATYKEKNKFRVPIIEDINSINIAPAKVGLGIGTKDELFNLNKKEHLDMVNNILNWLKSGKVMGNTKCDIISHGGTPTYLIIELKDGTKIHIQSAVNPIATKVPNGTEIKGENVSGQVTLYISNIKEPIREFSPELKSFIDNGWKSFFNYTH